MNGRLLAEADPQRYFSVSPPCVHQMELTFARAGLIRHVPGVARRTRSCSSRNAYPSYAVPNLSKPLCRGTRRGLMQTLLVSALGTAPPD